MSTIIIANFEVGDNHALIKNPYTDKPFGFLNITTNNPQNNAFNYTINWAQFNDGDADSQVSKLKQKCYEVEEEIKNRFAEFHIVANYDCVTTRLIFEPLFPTVKWSDAEVETIFSLHGKKDSPIDLDSYRAYDRCVTFYRQNKE